jgi:hypothetical protein
MVDKVKIKIQAEGEVIRKDKNDDKKKIQKSS